MHAGADIKEDNIAGVPCMDVLYGFDGDESVEEVCGDGDGVVDGGVSGRKTLEDSYPCVMLTLGDLDAHRNGISMAQCPQPVEGEHIGVCGMRVMLVGDMAGVGDLDGEAKLVGACIDDMVGLVGHEGGLDGGVCFIP